MIPFTYKPNWQVLIITMLRILCPVGASGSCASNSDCLSASYYTTVQDRCFMGAAFTATITEGFCEQGQCQKKTSLGQSCAVRRHGLYNSSCVTGWCSALTNNCGHQPGVGDQCLSQALTTTTTTTFPTPSLYDRISCNEVKRGRLDPYRTVSHSFSSASTVSDLTVSTCGSTFDTQLKFYAGQKVFECDDCGSCGDLEGCESCGEKTSVLRFNSARAGVEFKIEVSGWDDSAGDYSLYVHCCSSRPCSNNPLGSAGNPRPTATTTSHRPTRNPTLAPTCVANGVTPLDPSILPGFTRGFNAFTDTTASSPIIDATNYSQKKNVMFRQCLTRVPNVIAVVSNVPSCVWKEVSVQHSYTSYDTFSMQSANSISASIGFPIPTGDVRAFGSLSRVREDARLFSSSANASFFEMRQECLLADVGLVSPTFWTLTRDFLADVVGLPKSFSNSSLAVYQAFWSTYGTHVFRSAKLGGEFEAVFASDSCSWTTRGYTRDEVKMCIGGSIKGNDGIACSGVNVKAEHRRSASSLISSTWAMVRGGSVKTFREQIEAFMTPNVDKFGAFDAWLLSLNSNLAMIKGSSIPIHMMLTHMLAAAHRQYNIVSFPNAPRQIAALKAAFNAAIKQQAAQERSVSSLEGECPELDSSDGPSQARIWCSVIVVCIVAVTVVF